MSNEGVSTLSGVCIAINMMIGAGMLALPSGFVNGGIISSIIILGIICFWMIISCLWEGRSVVQCGRILKVGSKIPEVTEAFYVFCGTRWRDTYAIVLGVSFLSCSWVLAILFSQTLSSSIPGIYHSEEICFTTSTTSICNTRYLINMMILALITTPLALMDAKEQSYIQNTLTVIRVLRIILMCVTPLLAITSTDMFESFSQSFQDSNIIISPPFWIGTTLGLTQILSAAVFSQFLNGSVPIVVDCLSNRNNFLPTIHYTFLICFILYLLLSLIVAYKFGNHTMNPCNLNWAGYRWPSSLVGDECPINSYCDISAKIVEFIVVFCPAIDVASAYPFLGIILGNSATELIYGPPPDLDPLFAIGSLQNSNNNQNNQQNILSNYKLKNKLLRFFMNILPMILAVTLTDFSRVIQLTGVVSVLLCMVYPPLLSMRTNEYLNNCDPIYIFDDQTMEWVDPITTKTGTGIVDIQKKKEVRFQYGTIDQTEIGIEDISIQKNFLRISPKNDFIELKSFQIFVLLTGVILASIIFYVSL